MKEIKTILLITIIAAGMLLSGCGTTESNNNTYTLNQIYSEEAYGFYVKEGDDFIPITSISENSDENNPYEWIAGGLDCPTVTEKHPLVAVFSDNESMPESYFLNEYENLGYTIGASIVLENGNIYLDSDVTCENSDAATICNDSDFSGKMEIQSINGKTPPESNVDTEINIMKNFEANKDYEFSIYSGTSIRTGIITADTEVFKLTGRTDFSVAPLKKTTENYFIVTLPEDLSPGYYQMNGLGFFRYSGN